MRTAVNCSTFLLTIVGLWLWTITVAFQLQHKSATSNMKFMRHIKLYSSETDDDDDPMVAWAPEQKNDVFSREIYERKRGDFEVEQSYGGRSLASTLVGA